MHRASISDPEFRYDDADAEGFRAGMFRLGPRFGAEQTGTSLYEIPAGEALCPYHYEYGEEEWLLVVAGTPSVRTPEGTERLAPSDIVFFTTGPAGAHQVLNESDAPVRVLMWSTIATPGATVYPDSDKIGIWTGNRSDDVLVPRSAGVDYYHGESR